jgi:glutaminyl-peptide cyclotransferase
MMLASILLAATATAATPLSFTSSDAHLAYETARGLVEDCTPRDGGTHRAGLAALRILDAASAAGADVRRDAFRAQTPKGERQFTNLYGTFRPVDPDARWVVLVSHYDTKPGVACPGANDGASTSGLLVALANAYTNWPERKGNLLLVWTDGEECQESYGENDGLWGSKRAAAWLKESGRSVQAVVCLDMLGDKDLSISVPANGSAALAKIARHAARRIERPDLVKLVKEHVKDDHVAFAEKGFKAIDLIDFSYGPNNSFWHTPQDSLENISEESLLTSGRLVAELLNILL